MKGTPQPGAEPILRVDGVSAQYGRLRALQAITMNVAAGDITLVLGPNGAGKSTLMRTLAGLLRAASGKIVLKGRDVTRSSAASRAGKGLILVPENRGPLPGLTVSDNLELGNRLARRRGVEPLDRDVIWTLFPRLAERMWQDCASLSGGEMQMLAIARAMCARPHALLLDEPSRGVAPLLVGEIYAALHELNDGGLPIVLVEQKSVPLWRAPNETVVLIRGRVAHRMSDVAVTEDELASLYLNQSEPANV